MNDSSDSSNVGEQNLECSAASELVPRCPLCASSDSTFLYWNRDRLYGLPGRYGLVECRGCGLVRLSPRPVPESIQSFYPQEEYYSYLTKEGSIAGVGRNGRLGAIRDRIRDIVIGSLGYPTVSAGRLNRALEPIVSKLFFRRGTYGWGNKLPRFVKGGTALDVGSGNGRYLSFLKHHGWVVHGLDFSRTAAKFAKIEFDIDVHVGAFERASFAPESFDYINLSHVLEHTFDPVETMKIVERLLKRGGRAYIEVPNFQSFSRRWSGKYWYPWEVPRHLFMFSAHNLMMLVERSGLTVELMRTENGNFWPWDHTYRLEEERGERFETRPVVRGIDNPKLLLLKGLSALNRRIRPQTGDFICCWVKK